ncbi:hypothetical protein [Pseudomonas putida]|uniref:hypothetical protein n=1 Tax=Pseudomonas putida TaxID=303 RepID=UPI0037CAACDA
MRIDKARLKALAEMQPVQLWARTRGRRPDMKGRPLMYGVEGPEGVSDYSDWGFTGKAADYIAAADPATILALLVEIDALHDRAAYWRQRAKSAEGHFWNGDCRAAFDEVHRASNYAETPFDELEVWQIARIQSVVIAVLRTVNAQRELRRPADFVAYREEISGKVICDLDLFEDLRDSAANEAEQHRQYMGGYRPERQQLLDQIVERCDRLIADATDWRNNQNLTHKASNHSVD